MKADAVALCWGFTHLAAVKQYTTLHWQILNPTNSKEFKGFASLRGRLIEGSQSLQYHDCY